ncbi:hypothetical protein GCM10022251_47920 [Phytohabitans flavus]|uniref:Cupin 2 conserved barrel domain-containing protein n=2 Tax=Phytohabitans flavus TaxID=1076124 RepID=A0A6F8Y8T7_9ACTN|nr:hypothetical protein Pflav_087810 [Phytohabitans flavus]
MVKSEEQTRPVRLDGWRDASLTRIAELPVGVSVVLYEVQPGGCMRLSGQEDHEALMVLAGSGWVEADDGDRQPVGSGHRVSVRPDDSVTIGTERGLALLSIFGGWMLPE